MMPKLVFLFSAISGMLAVGLGAFGAHALKDKLTSNGYVDTFQTAVHYQFYHTLALFLIGILMLKFPSPWLNNSAYSMMIGILIFSGSLYTLSLTGVKWLGAITPIGGLGFLVGWFCLLAAIWKMNF